LFELCMATTMQRDAQLALRRNHSPHANHGMGNVRQQEQSDELASVRAGGGGGPGRDVKLVQDVAHMPVNGSLADA
jgi:hypothetical protein